MLTFTFNELIMIADALDLASDQYIRDKRAVLDDGNERAAEAFAEEAQRAASLAARIREDKGI